MFSSLWNYFSPGSLALRFPVESERAGMMDERMCVHGLWNSFVNLQAGDKHHYQFAYKKKIIKHNLKKHTVHIRLFAGRAEPQSQLLIYYVVLTTTQPSKILLTFYKPSRVCMSVYTKQNSLTSLSVIEDFGIQQSAHFIYSHVSLNNEVYSEKCIFR